MSQARLASASAGERVQIFFEGDPLQARAGESVVGALLAAGVVETSRSLKYRRPRGAYCLTGDCGTCLVRIDGRPSVKCCAVRVCEGMRIEAQNTIRPGALDATRLVDSVFSGGIDHHHLLLRPKIANTMMAAVARSLAGLGELPTADPLQVSHEHVEIDVLVVGAGSAGRAAAEILKAEGVEHLVVDRADSSSLGFGGAAPHALRSSTAVFGAWAGEGLVGAVQCSATAELVITIAARQILVATGCRDPMLDFAENDRPGIVSGRGLLRLLRADQMTIVGRCVVVGDPPYSTRIAEALEPFRAPHAVPIHVVPLAQLSHVLGRRSVSGIALRDGTKIPCELLALAGAPAPAHELACLLGAKSGFDGSGFSIERDSIGRCSTMGQVQIWAAGDVCGYGGPEAAETDGRSVALHLVEALRA